MKKIDVWLGVGGLVLKKDKILVVKKAYSKTKGLWTFPGGFVQGNETMDEAIQREIKEETSIAAKTVGVIGGRSGVLKTGVSDNLILFYLDYLSGKPIPRIGEIEEAAFLTVDEILNDPNTTDFMIEIISFFKKNKILDLYEFMPRRDYGYLNYKIFK